jgi:hypothetical protein
MRFRMLSCLVTLVLAGNAAAADATRVFMEKGELHYIGYLDDDANRRLFALYDSLATKPSVLAITSRGGDVATGLDLGHWVHEKKLDIKVTQHCLSSCANYIFTAGARKVVGNSAVIGFHGGISSQSFDLAGETKTRYAAMTAQQQQAFWARLREDTRPLLERETGFFKRIGVRQEITTYGQAARFEKTVPDGWTFSEEGFRRFGVDRIEVLDGPWRPRPERDWKITMLEVDGLSGLVGPRTH